VQWTSGETINTPGQNASQPDVAALPAGQAIAIWSRNNGTNDIVQAAVRDSSGVWGNASDLSATGQSAFEPKIATDPNGNSVAVWTRSDGTFLRVQAAYRPSGGSFGTVQSISDPGQNAFEPEVSMDPQGNAVAVWTRHDGTVNKDRIQAALRPVGGASVFAAAESLSTSTKNGFEPDVAAEANGNAVAVWSISDGTLAVQSSSRLDVPGYVRPQGAANLRVPLMIAYNPCSIGTANRTHGPALSSPSCNPAVQSSNYLMVGVFDANGFQPQNVGFVKVTVCTTGTTGTGICSTPAGMTTPDVRIQFSTTDVRCRFTNAACPGGFGADYLGKLGLRMPLRITDKSNGTLLNDPATTTDFDYVVAVPCTSTPTTIGASCSLTTAANAVLAGSVSNGKRANWEINQIEVKDSGPNGTGYASCPPTCGDGDETVFERQGVFIP